MKQVLFIRPDTREDGNIEWCVSGSPQVETLAGWQALCLLADHPLASRVCLLLPANEMIFRRFTLPKKGLSGQATPFSWMAEETLMGEVDDLHWTVLNKKGREVDAVAIDAGRLQHWLTLCDAAGLKVIQALPDAFLLPLAAGGITLLQMEERYWLRYSPFGASVADAGLVPLLAGKPGDGMVCCYGKAPEGVAVEETLPWQHPLLLIQPQWKACRANMLHGPFASRGGEHFRFLKPAMVAAVVLGLGLLLGSRVGLAWMLVEQENQTQQEMVELARHYFPTLRQTTNLKYHFGQYVKKENKGIFLQIYDLERVQQAVPAVAIDDMAFDDTQNQLTLSLSASTPQALEDFMSRSGEWFDFTLQPISDAAPYTAIITGKHK